MGFQWGSFRGLLREGIRSWRSAGVKPLGVQGERVAARYLRRKGYRLVGVRARDRLGEIDLVCVDGSTLVFVEVKTRRSAAIADPGEAVDAEKQRRVARAALSFLRRHDLLETPVRFDVVSVIWKAGERPQISHLPAAFEPPGRWQMHS